MSNILEGELVGTGTFLKADVGPIRTWTIGGGAPRKVQWQDIEDPTAWTVRDKDETTDRR